jgi:hypothetical protein
MWAGNLVFDPRSIRCPANLRQRVPSRRFYRPREGKDSTWVDDSTTPEEEYQRRYYLVEVPGVVDVGEERKSKKSRRADTKSPSTVVDRVMQYDSHRDSDDSDVTVDMSETGVMFDRFDGGQIQSGVESWRDTELVKSLDHELLVT